MKKGLFVVLAFILAITMLGCGKKADESTEPISMETLSTINVAAPVTPVETKPAVKVEPIAQVSTAPATLENLPPSGPYKPTGTEIQTALKNAGFYAASIDGKVGPKTKKAIIEFQKANNLKADGKVGPKTWEALVRYLSSAAKQ